MLQSDGLLLAHGGGACVDEHLHLEEDTLRKPLRERLKEASPTLVDGAMGTMLMAAGLESGMATESWNLSHPDKVLAVHRAYLEAGAEVILTNTLGGTGRKLARSGLGDKVYEANRRGAEIARQAAGEDAYVLGDIGSIGEFLEPLGNLSREEAVEAFAEQARALRDGGVDGFLVETMSDLEEALAACEGVRLAAPELPVMCTMTFDARGRTIMGTTAQQAAQALYAFGLDALGTNCGQGPEEMLKVIQAMAAVCPEAVLIAEPNAGTPRLVEGVTHFDATPETMADYALQYASAGVKIIGACCGSTPAHIEAMAKALGKR
mgnify:CR=1 FL=1